MPSVALYNFSKRINSTKRPSGSGTTFSCAINEPGSIGKHTLTLKITSATAPDYNYAVYNGKYYYIKDISNDINNIWYLYLEEDDLATHKSSIGNTYAYIKYGDKGDYSIADPRAAFRPSLLTSAYSERVTWGSWGHWYNDNYEIYGVVCINTDSGPMWYYTSITQLLLDVDQLTDQAVDKIKKRYQGIYGMILSCHAYPWGPATLTDSIGIWVAENEQVTLASSKSKKLNEGDLYTLYSCDLERNNQFEYPFAHIPPYTSYQVFCPYYGFIELGHEFCSCDASNATCGVNIVAEIEPVQGALVVSAYSGSKLITRRVSQVGWEISFSGSSNNKALNALAGVKAGLGLAGGLGATIGGLATGNLPVAAAGVGSMIATAAKAATSFDFSSNYHNVSTRNDVGGGMVYEGPITTAGGTKYVSCVLIVTEPDETQPSGYYLVNNALMGAPVFRCGYVKDWGPFVLCDCASVEIDESPEVINAINSALSSGLYYE